MAAYPLVPKHEVGFRIQVTAANGEDEIDELIAALTSLKERFQLHQTVGTRTLTAANPCPAAAVARDRRGLQATPRSTDST